MPKQRRVTAPSLLADLSDIFDLSIPEKVTAILVAAFLGFLIGLPWEDIGELKALRKSQMSATLTLTREDRQ